MKTLINKDILIYNSIPHQNLSSPHQLTIKAWNDAINSLSVQTNELTKYLKQLHEWMMGDESLYQLPENETGFIDMVFKDHLNVNTLGDQVRHLQDTVDNIPILIKGLTFEEDVGTIPDSIYYELAKGNVAHIEADNSIYTLASTDAEPTVTGDELLYATHKGNKLIYIKIYPDKHWQKYVQETPNAFIFDDTQSFLNSITLTQIPSGNNIIYNLKSIQYGSITYDAEYINIGLVIYIHTDIYERELWLAYKQQTWASDVFINDVKLSLFKTFGQDHEPLLDTEIDDIIKNNVSITANTENYVNQITLHFISNIDTLTGYDSIGFIGTIRTYIDGNLTRRIYSSVEEISNCNLTIQLRANEYIEYTLPNGYYFRYNNIIYPESKISFDTSSHYENDLYRGAIFAVHDDFERTLTIYKEK